MTIHSAQASTAGAWPSRGRQSAVDVVVISLPLAVAAVNTSRGTIAALLAIGWVLARQGAHIVRNAAALDLLMALAAVMVLASPHWVPGLGNEYASASYGPAVNIIYALCVRRVLLNRSNFANFLRGTALLTTAYAVYFLTQGQAIEASTSVRQTVDFANANYTGAILAYGVSVSVWMARGTSNRRLRILALVSVGVQVWAVLQTGSRASMAGAAAAAIVLVIGPSVRTYRVSAIGLVFSFCAGFLPAVDRLALWASESLAAVSYFNRQQSALADASGRLELWAAARNVAMDAWLTGWGTERYRLQPGGPGFLAHSWGMEYLASVGVLGSAIRVAVFTLSYLTPYRSRSADGILLVTASAFALAPSLMLSTHQWTLWLWAAVAVWSRSHLSGSADGFTQISSRSRPGSQRSSTDRKRTRPSASRRVASPASGAQSSAQPD